MVDIHTIYIYIYMVDIHAIYIYIYIYMVDIHATYIYIYGGYTRYIHINMVDIHAKIPWRFLMKSIKRKSKILKRMLFDFSKPLSASLKSESSDWD